MNIGSALGDALDGLILGIETSCDESALALFTAAGGISEEWISSQIDLHSEYGGVVPDLASREHLTNLPLLLEELGRTLTGDSPVKAIAVTQGPGLAGCLAMGLASAKALALAWDCPLYGVNHLRAHLFSSFIETHRRAPSAFETTLGGLLPHLGLLVSGGNTLMVRLEAGPALTVVGSTIDDAAGEALDKGAKLLGLGYPGGPRIEQEAENGRRDAFDFPRALLRPGNTDFSFSGLKTSLRYRIEAMDTAEVDRAFPDLCASYQEAVVDVLGRKVGAELARGDYRSVGLSGGVANNRSLRRRMSDVSAHAGIDCLAALPRHTGDNAGMVAFAAWMERRQLQPDDGFSATIEPGMQISSKGSGACS